VIRVHIPRLRDRNEDIPKLAAHFLGRAAREMNVEPKVAAAGHCRAAATTVMARQCASAGEYLSLADRDGIRP
jgi:transcriptional regulator with AAA-type ATPase domain